MNIGGIAKALMGGGLQGLLGNLFGGGGAKPALQLDVAPGAPFRALGTDNFNPIQGLPSGLDLLVGGRKGGKGTNGLTEPEPDLEPELFAGGRGGKGGGGTGGLTAPEPTFELLAGGRKGGGGTNGYVPEELDSKAEAVA